jgi:Flavin containing amine oxidoreductase/NAD(P)-binding Rossmann-like domain
VNRSLEMVLKCSNEEVCDSQNGKTIDHESIFNTTASIPLDKRFKVVIVGAGASGLQCCYSLVHQYQISLEDILLLEARPRIGGRIYTTSETVVSVKQPSEESNGVMSTQNGHVNDSPTITFQMDHGAAWVHGTGYDFRTSSDKISRALEQSSVQLVMPSDDVESPENATCTTINPVMHLLQLEAAVRRSGMVTDGTMKSRCDPGSKNVYDDLQINPLVDGNPWMRPRSVLHNQGRLGLFVAGQYIDNTTDFQRSIIDEALHRHYTILREVQRIGNGMYKTGRGMETTTTSLADVIRKVLNTMPDLVEFQRSPESMPPNDEEDLITSQQIAAIAPFYMLLLECWYGCETSVLQLCEFIEEKNRVRNHEDEHYTPEGDFVGPHCTLQNGMSSALQPLLRNGVKERIQLEQEVTQIGYSDETAQNCITVETSSGLRVHSDTCVVTIPAGCLKDAVVKGQLFATPLSSSKLEALSFLKMGTYKKVFLTFDRIFWPVKPPFIGLIRHVSESCDTTTATTGASCEDLYRTKVSHPVGNCLLVDNLWALRGVPSFEVVLFGLAGRWSTGKSDEAICTAILDFIADAMSIDRTLIQQYFVSCHVTRWEEDKYSRGAYSYMALGALERHSTEIQRPEWDNRLVFAGEATISEYEGSVYSALYSGMNAAKSVHEFFQPPS